MIFRNFKQISTGRWMNVLMTNAGNAFSVPAESHRDEIAAGFGIASADVQVVDSLGDARVGTLIPAPASPPPPPDPDSAAFDAGTVADKIAILRRRVLTASQRS